MPQCRGTHSAASPPNQPAQKNGKKRDSEKNLFGTDFPWVEGDFTADGKTFKKVGVRYAGSDDDAALNAGNAVSDTTITID